VCCNHKGWERYCCSTSKAERAQLASMALSSGLFLLFHHTNLYNPPNRAVCVQSAAVHFFKLLWWYKVG